MMIWYRAHYGSWADGNIEYGDLNVSAEDEANLEYYIEDEEFANLMRLFLKTMRFAYKDGGLYCDQVVSK